MTTPPIRIIDSQAARAALTEALLPVLGEGEATLPFGLSRARMEVNLGSLSEHQKRPPGTPETRQRAREVMQQILAAGLAEGPGIGQWRRTCPTCGAPR